MKALMATDGSKLATAALVAAGRLLSPENRSIELVCVVPNVHRGHNAERDRLCRRAKRALARATDALKDAGLDVYADIRMGSPARTIIGASAGYDVTVVAATSHKPAPMHGLGPVASRVAEYGHGPTLLARNSRNSIGPRVLVAVDGSEASQSAVDQMARLMDLSEASVTLLHVTETPWLHLGPDQEWLGYEEDLEEEFDPHAQLEREFVREADEILLNARDRLTMVSAVDTLIYEGLPADEILSEAERGDYDLVVIAASGSQDLKHRILGSVSTKVAWNAPCSVLLVRGAEWQ